jgi:plasmid stabilization system protein ParE
VISWEERAIEDVEIIRNYIALDNPFYAKVFTERLVKHVERQKVFPRSGKEVPEYENENIR